MFQYGIVLVAIVSITTALPPCTCPRHMAPVCGSDGTTYNNECFFNCARSVDKQLTIENNGKCEQECFCTFNYSPVCGTDGNTYGNECSLRCLQKKSPLLDVQYRGQCKKTTDKVHVVETPAVEEVAKTVPQMATSACRCERKLNRVCGTNGVTYNNPCLLNCASQTYGAEIHVLKTGPCDANVAQKKCACGRNYKPVCGVNGVTYSNTCLMRCSGTDMARQGPCEDKQPIVHYVQPLNY